MVWGSGGVDNCFDAYAKVLVRNTCAEWKTYDRTAGADDRFSRVCRAQRKALVNLTDPNSTDNN